MHIEFKKLILHNFISFGHSELLFLDDGFIRVTGINENPLDNAGSNGSGKSSLWEALIWSLTGDTIRGTKQISNIYGEDGTYVEIEFNIDATHYRLIRSKDHKQLKTSLQIYIDGKDCSGKGIRDSEKLLEQYLPDITASLLGSVIVLGQGLPQKFTSNSPSGRKEVLEKLSKSDFMIEDLKSRVAKRKSELQADIRNYEDTLLSIQSQQRVLTQQIENAKAQLLTIDRHALEKRLPIVQDAVYRFTDQINLIQSALETINKDQQTLTNRLQCETQMYADKYDNLSKLFEPQIKQHQEAQANLNARIRVLDEEIRKLKNIVDICPTCGQKLVGVEKPDTSALEAERDDLLKDVQALTDVITGIMDNYQSDKKKLDAEKTLALNVTNADLRKLNLEYQTQSNLLKNTQRDLLTYQTEYNGIQSQLASLNATMMSLQETINNNSNQLDQLATQIVLQEDSKVKVQQHLDIVNKFDTALKRDFRGYLLQNIIQYISTRAKQYCKTIFDTELIEFQLDGNNIDISYMNKAYENLSGGEKQKIDLIIQFSIRDMLCNHLGFTSNILVLDEVFDGLDMIGCQRVLDVISNITDIKNIFIVTHRKDLSIPTDKEIIVVKSANGISELK